MKRILLVLLVGLLATGGVARGDGRTFAIASGESTLPSPAFSNGGPLILAPTWSTPPVTPVQLSYDQLLRLWESAGQAYGVPWNVLAAINKIESNFGRNMGPSSAGAIGWMQFMPSTWLRWGTDADGNGIADPWNPVDSIYSAARYLAASGAPSDLRQAVFSYNHAWWYVDDVLQLAQLYGSSDAAPAGAFQNQAADQRNVFALDRLQSQLEDATAVVRKASGAYRVALTKAEALADQERALAARAEAEPLLSDQLEAQKTTAQFGVVAGAAQAEADRLKSKLADAQATLAGLQGKAQAASFNQPAGRILSAAQAQADGRYVFPVGGGPSVVSVSHFHHDYPAADIAAPEGSPLYAVSDGTVLYAWSWDQRCGIGFTFQTNDGLTWTYCHLSYMYPSVRPGVGLKAGDPVGLVGATGDASGPHLHLQLQPATSYPQDQEWFQSFAGTAFHWSDEASTEAGTSPEPLVFHIVGPLD